MYGVQSNYLNCSRYVPGFWGSYVMVGSVQSHFSPHCVEFTRLTLKVLKLAGNYPLHICVFGLQPTMTENKETSCSFCTKIFICGFRKEDNVAWVLYINVRNIAHEYTNMYILTRSSSCLHNSSFFYRDGIENSKIANTEKINFP